MANRTPRKPATAEPPATEPAPGFWGWLQNPTNQKTLRFIGAGIVAAVGLLVTLGFIHKPEPSKSLPESSASQAVVPAPVPTPAPTQNAIASGGNATNIQGNENQIGTKSEPTSTKPAHKLKPARHQAEPPNLTSQPVPAPTQSAVANGGNATNIIGNGNRVETSKP